MNEITILTDKNVPNQSYTIENAALNRSDLIVVLKSEEKDEFLDEFIQGKTAYKIVINTDVAEIRIKNPVSVRNFIYGSNGTDELLSFIINLSPLN